MAVAATTELECINIMLAAIGEAPINSLTGTLPVDARIAQSTLSEVNKSVQSEGWSFNTEIDAISLGFMFAKGLSPWFAPWFDVRSVSFNGTPSTTNKGLAPDETDATPRNYCSAGNPWLPRRSRCYLYTLRVMVVVRFLLR